MKLANGGNYKSRSKLLNKKYHFDKESMKDNNIFVTHAPSVDMRADCLSEGCQEMMWIARLLEDFKKNLSLYKSSKTTEDKLHQVG